MADHVIPHADVVLYALGELEAAARADFEAHVTGCHACRADADELLASADLLRRVSGPIDVPEGLRARTLAAVRAEPAAEPRQPSRLARRVVGALGVAAVVLAAAGVTTRVVFRPRYDGEIVLQSAAGGRASGLARIRFVPAGREVSLDVSDLAPTPAGRHYECWFVGDGDTIDHPNRVSVGTFRVDADGRTRVTMTSSADRARYPKMGVTLELDDGDPQRGGPKVLVSK